MEVTLVLAFAEGAVIGGNVPVKDDKFTKSFEVKSDASNNISGEFQLVQGIIL
jgi:hypothetical protein